MSYDPFIQPKDHEAAVQAIVDAHQSTLALSAIPQTLSQNGPEASVYRAARQASLHMGFIEADAACVANAWQKQSERTGRFDAHHWPTEPLDFGIQALPRANSFPACPRQLGLYAVLPDAAWVGRMARAGVPPASGTGFIGHSQQCMLHGDCLLEDDEPMKIFKQAFDLACEGGAFFGYLDHPFSERYQYGWLTETQRASAHAQLIQHMRQRGRVLFANEDQAMDFLHDRAHTRIQATPEGFLVVRPQAASPWPLQVRYKGQSLCIEREGLVR